MSNEDAIVKQLKEIGRHLKEIKEGILFRCHPPTGGPPSGVAHDRGVRRKTFRQIEFFVMLILKST